MPIPEGHYIDLVDGRLAGTDAAQLDSIFKRIGDDAAGKHLVIHFHGGLVSRKSAHESGAVLFETYRGARTYPVFFVWNTNLGQILRHNLDEIVKEKAFRRLVLRVGQLMLGKLAEIALPPGARSAGDKLDPPSLKELPKDLEGLQAELDAREKALPGDPTTISELSEVQEEQAERELATDRVIQQEAERIANGLRDPAAVKAEMGSRSGSTVRGSTETLMSPSVLAEIAAESADPGSRGIGTLITLARYGTKVLRAVVKRYRAGRHHGLYGTIVQEVLRALYADNAGIIVWNMMKNDTRDAFGDDPMAHGGTAFLRRLAENWPDGGRVTLVGHSTGAVYIGRFLEAADDLLPPERKFDVVFLAAACSFPFIGERLDIFNRRVENIRAFGLSDQAERGYWEFPVLMNGSLLYFVSGVLEEDEADMPLVGMERYFSGAWPYEHPQIAAVADYLDDSRRVWTGYADDPGPGRRSTAVKHGDFDDTDETTRLSLAHILQNGF